jgi:hypothetical protein
MSKAPRKSPQPSPPLRARGVRGYLHRANLFTSLLLVFPLFLIYQVAVLRLPDAMNGADLLTARLWSLLGHSLQNYLVFNFVLLCIFLLALLVLRHRQHFELRLFLPVIFESGIYALTMGAAINFAMHLLGINPTLAIGGALHPLAVAAEKAGLATRIAISLGAGVHEELVFRLLLIPALTFLFTQIMGMGRVLALLSAFVISSVLFSAAHHVIGGDPFHTGVFVYRIFCGLIFATLFQFRGFAVAVYTHALYDIFVFLFGNAG